MFIYKHLCCVFNRGEINKHTQFLLKIAYEQCSCLIKIQELHSSFAR